MSGEDLIQLSKSVKVFSLQKTLRSYFVPSEKKLCVGPHKFVLRHELGHGLDNYPNNLVMRVLKRVRKSAGSIGSLKKFKKHIQKKRRFLKHFSEITTKKSLIIL